MRRILTGMLASAALSLLAAAPPDETPVHIEGFAIDGVEPRAADSDAPLAEGWPAASAPGSIAVKSYPAYRSAVARGPGAGPEAADRLFFPLFLHIRRSDVAMTAPVVITPPVVPAAGPGDASMEFVYRTPTLGVTGPGLGTVRVEDHPPATFLCLGVQGEMDGPTMARGLAGLSTWLDDHKASWVAAGPPRRLGYHGPMTSRDRRLWEIQIPVLAAGIVAAPGPEGWIDLINLDLWRPSQGGWQDVGAIRPDPEHPRLLAAEPGHGILTNGPIGKSPNLLTKQAFGDVEVHAEFLIPRKSNSGIKLLGVYEIQIFDSFGKPTAAADDCGGIYPRAELLPTYHHIDDGYPPKVNACRPPGEWQVLDLTFHAPRFDAAGQKVAPARFDRVILNGQVVHEDAPVPTPTGHAWHDAEHPTGPLLLQGDHGPVAFRALRLRPLSPGQK